MRSSPASVETQDARLMAAIVLGGLEYLGGLSRILQSGFWTAYLLHYWSFQRCACRNVDIKNHSEEP